MATAVVVFGNFNSIKIIQHYFFKALSLDLVFLIQVLLNALLSHQVRVLADFISLFVQPLIVSATEVCTCQRL